MSPEGWAHLHLVVNHLPVVAAPFAVVLMAAGALVRSEHLKRAGLATSATAALLAAAAYVSGGRAEHALDAIADASGPRIEEHEEAAEAALIVAGLSGAAAGAALALAIRRGATPRFALAIPLVLALAAAVVLGRAAYLGGPIRHSEIRDSGPASPSHLRGL